MKLATYHDYKSTAAWKNHVSCMHQFVYLISDKCTGVVTGACATCPDKFGTEASGQKPNFWDQAFPAIAQGPQRSLSLPPFSKSGARSMGRISAM